MDVIDWEKLSAKLGNRQPMVQKVLELVLQAHSDKGQQLKGAVENGDLAQIQSLIHALRGAFANVEVSSVFLEQAKLLELMAKAGVYRDWETDRKSTRLNSSHSRASRMPSSA